MSEVLQGCFPEEDFSQKLLLQASFNFVLLSLLNCTQTTWLKNEMSLVWGWLSHPV